MASVLLTILKVGAGLAVLGIISMVLIAIIPGLVSSARPLRNREDHDDNAGVG
jgi:hypothetical protein